MHLDEALTMMTPRLRIEETALNAAACLLDRLQFGLEDEDGTRKLLRAIITLMPCPPLRFMSSFWRFYRL